MAEGLEGQAYLEVAQRHGMISVDDEFFGRHRNSFFEFGCDKHADCTEELKKASLNADLRQEAIEKIQRERKYLHLAVLLNAHLQTTGS